MKKLVVFVLISFLIFINFQKSFAQESTSSPSSQLANVQYDLPYPGILPDNPLYFLKAIRDNVLGFLITDPLKKSEYDLLMADKRLVSSEYLLNKGKTDLSITTLSKAGNYFDQAISQAYRAKTQGEDANPILSRLLSASKKHQFVIRQMEEKSKDDVKFNLRLFEQRALDFQGKVEIIKSQ